MRNNQLATSAEACLEASSKVSSTISGNGMKKARKKSGNIAERAHFTLRVLTHRLPLPAQRAVHIATHLLIAGFGALAAWYGVKLAIVNSLLTSPALELNLAWLYAAPAVGGALIVLYGLAMVFEPPPPDADPIHGSGAAAAGND